MKSNRYIFILYDSVKNAVFESQVLQPIHKKMQKDPDQEWHIISFEKELSHLVHPTGITIHYFKRYPYVSSLCLWPNIRETRHILQQFEGYHLVARGPFAGYIACKARTTGCKSFTIQARGLAAEEYIFTHKKSFGILKHIRKQMMMRLEHWVYKQRHAQLTIEVVSSALGSYLIEQFQADAHIITIAKHDIPEKISPAERLALRMAIRDQLGLKQDRIIYCYNGSYKPWQCPQETVLFFKQELMSNSDYFLLILTPDTNAFEQLARQLNLAPHTYHICNVKQAELYAYLAASDIGILFRQPHIINQTSRPTKVLEYHAAGLTILHNGTVDYITQIAGIDHVLIPFGDIAPSTVDAQYTQRQTQNKAGLDNQNGS